MTKKEYEVIGKAMLSLKAEDTPKLLALLRAARECREARYGDGWPDAMDRLEDAVRACEEIET